MSDTNHKYRYPDDYHDRSTDSARYEEDPLVELARIVSGGSYYPEPEPEPKRQEPVLEEPAPDEEILAEGEHGDDGFVASEGEAAADADFARREPTFEDFGSEPDANAFDPFAPDEAAFEASLYESDIVSSGKADAPAYAVDAPEAEDAVEWGVDGDAIEVSATEPEGEPAGDDPFDALERELFQELNASVERVAVDGEDVEEAHEPLQSSELKFVPVWGDEAEDLRRIEPTIEDVAEPVADSAPPVEEDEPVIEPEPRITGLSDLADSLVNASTRPVEDDRFSLGRDVTYHAAPPSGYGVSTMDLYQRIRAIGFDEAPPETGEEALPETRDDVADEPVAVDRDVEAHAPEPEQPVAPVDVFDEVLAETRAVAEDTALAEALPSADDIDVAPAPETAGVPEGEEAPEDAEIANFDLSAYSPAYAMTAPAARVAAGMAAATAVSFAHAGEEAESVTPDVALKTVEAPVVETADEEAFSAVEPEAADPVDADLLLEDLLANELAGETFEHRDERDQGEADLGVPEVTPERYAFDEDRFEAAISANFDAEGPQTYHASAPDVTAFEARTDEEYDLAAPVDLDEVYGRGDADDYGSDEIAAAAAEARPVFADEQVLPEHDEEEVAVTPAGEASRRGMWAAAAMGALVIVGVIGFVGYRMVGSPTESGPPPVIEANADPVKVRPESTPVDDQDQRSKLIYDRVSGDTGQERLIVPGEETVMPLEGENNQPRVVGADANGTEGQATVNGVPRRVRTVVVRPDGTIISGEPEGAEASQPDEPKIETVAIRPTTSDVAADEQGVDQLAGNAQPSGDPASVLPPVKPGSEAPVETAAAQAPAAPDTLSAPALPPSPPAEDGNKVATRTITAKPVEIGAKAPVPTDRPVENRVVSTAPVRSVPTEVPAASNASEQKIRPVSPTVTRTASGQPLALVPGTGEPAAAQPSATAAAPAARSGDYLVQVTSQRTESQARIAYQSLQRRYSSLLANETPLIERADLGDKGTYYRVRIGPMDRDGANSFCNDLKSKGGECFVRRR